MATVRSRDFEKMAAKRPKVTADEAQRRQEATVCGVLAGDECREPIDTAAIRQAAGACSVLGHAALRRGEWVRADGGTVTAATRVARIAARTQRRRVDPVRRAQHQQWRPLAADALGVAERSWLIPGGDIDAWRWDGVEALAALPAFEGAPAA